MLLLILALAIPAHADQRGDDFYATFALARHVGIRAEVAAKIALISREAGAALPGAGDRLEQGLREGNLMKASAGLPANPRDEIDALIAIRAQLPLEALDCESGGAELNCLSSANALADSFTPVMTEFPPATLTAAEREKLNATLMPAPATVTGQPRAFLGASDAWTASELFGEEDVSAARGFFDAMYQESP